jgi:hypothetical protein
MGKLIVCNIVSLDGYYTGQGGDVMVMPMDQAFDAHNAERLRAAETLLLGRTTYQGFRSFWPSVDGDPKWSPTNWEVSPARQHDRQGRRLGQPDRPGRRPGPRYANGSARRAAWSLTMPTRWRSRNQGRRLRWAGGRWPYSRTP